MEFLSKRLFPWRQSVLEYAYNGVWYMFATIASAYLEEANSCVCRLWSPVPRTTQDGWLRMPQKNSPGKRVRRNEPGPRKSTYSSHEPSKYARVGGLYKRSNVVCMYLMHHMKSAIRLGHWSTCGVHKRQQQRQVSRHNNSSPVWRHNLTCSNDSKTRLCVGGAPILLVGVC